MKIALSLIALFFSVNSLACKPRAPRDINLHVDLEKGIRKFYSTKRLLDQRPSLSFENCGEIAAAKKFIMLGLGIENLVLTNDIIGYNFSPEEESLECKLKNNPFTNQESSQERFDKNTRKRNFFNRCVVVQVTELNENVELVYPEEQPGCNITKNSKWSVDFSGPYCFFQPTQRSNLSVHIDLKEECLTPETLGKKQTILSDYNALLNSYVAGDATGFSPDLSAISTTSIRLSIAPPNGILSLSEDFGSDRPRFPSTWMGANIFLGKLDIKTYDGLYDEIKLPLVADTRCERKCVGKLCSSPCDFSQPIVGEFTLYEKLGNKREFIKLWHDGSIASANYQGLLHGMGVTLPGNSLEVGKKYEIEAKFREPDLDFAYFSGRITRELRLSQNHIGPLSRTGRINYIPEIRTIGRTGVMPQVPVIRNLTFENNELDGLSRTLATWRSKLSNAFWPPFYDQMCNGPNCQSIGSGFVTLKMTFVLDKNENGEWQVNMQESRRNSNIVSNRTFGPEEVPTLDCGLNDDEDNDDFDFDWGDIL